MSAVLFLYTSRSKNKHAQLFFCYFSQPAARIQKMERRETAPHDLKQTLDAHEERCREDMTETKSDSKALLDGSKEILRNIELIGNKLECVASKMDKINDRMLWVLALAIVMPIATTIVEWLLG